eukprot:3241347-Prymnesium_polylepis.1
MTTNALRQRQARRRHFSTWCQKPLSCFDPGSTVRCEETTRRKPRWLRSVEKCRFAAQSCCGTSQRC